MKDKLRELAERWRRHHSQNGGAIEYIQCANELRSILDAEGDSVAAATVGQPPEREELVSASLAIGGWLAAALDDPAVCAEMKRDINRWFDAAMPSAQTHPARSGVVSDEDVEEACRKYYNCGHPVYPPVFEGMRAALEHFTAIAQEKQHGSL